MEERSELEWLENWLAEDMDIGLVDLVFEFLRDRCLLTDKGEELAYEFWKKHIRKRD